MANHTYSKGLLYKKTLNSSGEVTGSVPLLLKTLGSLVIMSDGTDAETAISTAISNMVTPDETTIVTGQDGITISVKKSTSAEIDEILGDVPTSHTWEGYYTKSETEALIDAVDDKISQSGIETALGYTPIPTTAKGSNNGVAELDSAGKVPASQLPSYVDDVIESATYAALPATGEAGKIYVTLNDDKTYRWSGSAYVEISASLALGETSSTAYRGDRGKTAYDHSQAAHARTDATNAAIVSGKLNINGTATNIGDFKAVSTVASQGLTDTEKTNALANIGAVPNSDFVEVVDNGAKNYACQNSASLTTTISTGDWVIAQQLSFVEPIAANTPVQIDFDYTTSTHINEDLRLQLTDSQGLTIYETRVYSTGADGHISETVVPPVNVHGYTVKFEKAGTATVSNIMICTKSQFNISDKYEPYALGNQYLTPELIELCDSGAKNILKINQASSASAPCFTSDLANTVTINGAITSGGEAFDLNRINGSLVLPAGTYVISTPDDMSNLGFRYYERVGGTLQNQSSERGEKFLIFTVSGSATENWCRLESNVGTVFSNRTVRLMVCTKAAFGVSSKFVPYRPSYDLVCQNIKDVNTVLEAVL